MTITNTPALREYEQLILFVKPFFAFFSKLCKTIGFFLISYKRITQILQTISSLKCNSRTKFELWRLLHSCAERAHVNTRCLRLRKLAVFFSRAISAAENKPSIISYKQPLPSLPCVCSAGKGFSYLFWFLRKAFLLRKKRMSAQASCRNRFMQSMNGLS